LMQGMAPRTPALIPLTSFRQWNKISAMSCEVEYTDEFGAWWEALSEGEQDDVDAVVSLLEERGVRLPFPYSSQVRGSRHSHMRELRIQSGGNPLRIFYAFDPRRTAILLIGGNKAGDDRFYERFVPWADELYDVYLKELKEEGLIP
jgi:hypothetical protein